jgi:orotidine-5'-phosphate decarboxylase
VIPADKIIVALDFSDRKKLSAFYDEILGYPVWVKVGMEVFYSFGTDVISEARDKGFKIFLDLKLHDIPNTVSQALKALCQHKVDMINVHASGGSEMMRRALEAVKSSPYDPLLIAVTQLTSTTSEEMNREQRIPGNISQSVAHYAKLALESGCAGVVCSPQEVASVKLTCGSSFLTITPGIRPANSEIQDQKRTSTPLEALKSGADFLVIGRPITQALNRRKALENILKGN